MPEPGTLQALQAGFTAHIRNPSSVPLPAGIEKRRMKIYNDLVYNNIESFLRSGFPVLCSLYREEDWHLLVRDFIASYRCQSPYFLEISQEFLNYLMEERQTPPLEPPFILELAHYEGVELALDVAMDTLPLREEDAGDDTLAGVPVLSPLVWSLRYSFPVHLIGPSNQPESAPAEPTYLVVYRNREEQVKFLESNAATARLLEMLSDNPGQLSGRRILEKLAAEMNPESVTPVIDFGAKMLEQFLQADILVSCRP